MESREEGEVTARRLLLETMLARGLPADLAEWIAETAEVAAARAVEGIGRYLDLVHGGEAPPLLTSIAVLAVMHRRLAEIEADVMHQLAARGDDPGAARSTFDLSKLGDKKRQDVGVAWA